MPDIPDLDDERRPTAAAVIFGSAVLAGAARRGDGVVSDLVKRLRYAAERGGSPICDEAADRIEELEGEWNGEAQALMNAGWLAPEEASVQRHRLADARARSKAYADRIERLEAALAWQPIETAPKDGTRVDLWDGVSRWTAMVWIDSSPQDPSGAWSHDLLDWRRAYGWLRPTHWRPIPDPPALAEGTS